MQNNFMKIDPTSKKCLFDKDIFQEIFVEKKDFEKNSSLNCNSDSDCDSLILSGLNNSKKSLGAL